jgi:alkylhydroperoxidase family enzyme
MAWIKTIPPAEATGALKTQYDAAIRRAGRVYNILRIMSPNPAVLRDAIAFYRTLMYEESPLCRALRELIATVVSRANHCHY